MRLDYPHPQGNYKLQPSSVCLRFSPRIPPNSSFAWKFPARQSSQEPSQICPGKRPLREYLICSGVPPDVALVMAQAASFLVRNSAFCRISISTGKMLASMTAWEERAGRGGWDCSQKASQHLKETSTSISQSKELPKVYPSSDSCALFLRQILLNCRYSISSTADNPWNCINAVAMLKALLCLPM